MRTADKCVRVSLRTGRAAASRGMLVCGRCVERTSVSKFKTNAEAQTLRSSALGDVLLHYGFVLRPPPSFAITRFSPVAGTRLTAQVGPPVDSNNIALSRRYFIAVVQYVVHPWTSIQVV